MSKYSRLRERLLAEGILAPDQLYVPPPASDSEILQCHESAYLERVVTGTLSTAEIRRIGFPWSPQMVERSRRSSGATIMAARTALCGEGISANLAGGTHHACHDHGEGYCVFNDAAIAARAMQAEGLTEADYGAAISLNGLIIVLVTIPVTAWATKRPRYKVLAGATVLFAVGFGFNVFANATVLLYMLGVAIWTLGELISAPVGNAVVSDLAPAALRGTYMGVFGMAWGMGSAIAPIIGGKILATAGGDALWVVCFGVGMLAAVGWWIAGRSFQHQTNVETVISEEPRPA